MGSAQTASKATSTSTIIWRTKFPIDIPLTFSNEQAALARRVPARNAGPGA